MGLQLSKCKIFFAAAMTLCIFLFPVLSVADALSPSDPPPALLLSGTLDETPQTAALCAPLNIQYSVENTGTVPVSGGQLIIEIKSAVTGQSVFTRQLPFTLEPGSLMIENVDFPQGAYTIILKASAWNGELQITRDFTLAKQALTVTPPILVEKGNAARNRVLVWLSRTGAVVQQAFAEKILKQAFEDENFRYATVDSAEDFTNQAMSGEFNTLVLFESDELLERTDWLTNMLLRGQGIVIIGSEDRTRMVAETFGFKFREAPPAAGATLLLTEDSGMGLLGTIPVSGRILQPQKKGAKAAALFTGDKKPAILIDNAGKGRVIVMPFSFTRSALDTGSTSLYSLLLRTAVLNVSPGNDEQTGISSMELLVSAPSGPVKARIVETLPQGTRVFWASAEGTIKNNTILFDLTADDEPQKLQYWYKPPAGNKTPAFTEIFYECNGKLVRQGKIE